MNVRGRPVTYTSETTAIPIVQLFDHSIHQLLRLVLVQLRRILENGSNPTLRQMIGNARHDQKLFVSRALIIHTAEEPTRGEREIEKRIESSKCSKQPRTVRRFRFRRRQRCSTMDSFLFVDDTSNVYTMRRAPAVSFHCHLLALCLLPCERQHDHQREAKPFSYTLASMASLM